MLLWRRKLLDDLVLSLRNLVGALATLNKACYRQHCWSVGVFTSRVITSVYGNKGINTFQSLRNKTRLISKQCFNRTAHTEGYNFATEQPIAASIAPIDAQLNAHSNGTNNSICANCGHKVGFLKLGHNWYFADFEITMEMCCDDPPSHTEAISSSCTQAFRGNETAFIMEWMRLP